MNANITNWLSSAYQEFHKIIKDEIAPIVNQVDPRVQNFENQFVKEAAKFVRDFKYLAKEADESLDKTTVLETEIERLLRAVISHNIMSIVQRKPPLQSFRNQSVVRQSTAFQSERPKFPKNKFSPKVVEKNDLTKPVTSHSVPNTQESKVVKNANVKGGIHPERLAQGLEVGLIRRIQGLDTTYWGFLRVRTTLDIFLNIIFIPYFQYDVLVFSGYCVLIYFPLWSLVSAGTDTPYLP
ncbi:hypothetical protein Tco_0593116 [Tanacetum coccineum]